MKITEKEMQDASWMGQRIGDLSKDELIRMIAVYENELRSHRANARAIYKLLRRVPRGDAV